MTTINDTASLVVYVIICPVPRDSHLCSEANQQFHRAIFFKILKLYVHILVMLSSQIFFSNYSRSQKF